MFSFHDFFVWQIGNYLFYWFAQIIPFNGCVERKLQASLQKEISKVVQSLWYGHPFGTTQDSVVRLL
jgi:hypothetical protein